jgi:MIP family channel proteins
VSFLSREALAEFLGTFVLIIFGVGSVAQAVFSHSLQNPLSIHLAWGIAVTLGIYIAAGVSGAHLNPAVTLAMAVHRRFPWRKIPEYWFAQFLGAFFAAAVVFTVYHEALQNFDGGVRQVLGPQGTAGIWATYPQQFLSTMPGGLLDQIIGTALLVCVIFALSDQKNFSPSEKMAPLFVGATVVLIGVSLGYNAGYAINPARDFGPRLFTYFAGWGNAVFTSGNGWWWVPILGPLLGAILGGSVYDFLIIRRHPSALQKGIVKI